MRSFKSEPYSKRELDEILKVALQAADAAGDILRKYYRKAFQVNHKEDDSLVTQADIRAEAIIEKKLKKAFPDFRFIGEESKAKKTKHHDGFAWHVDPLDGTTNFAHGFPYFATSIGLAFNNQPILGVVYAPLMQEKFYGHTLGKAYCNGKPILVSKRDKLKDCLVATGFSFPKNVHFHDRIEQLARVLKACRGIRRPGAAALDLAYIARGSFDCFWDHSLQSWDVCAGMALVEAAGGRVGALSKTEPLLFSPDCIAVNKVVATKFIKLLRGEGKK